jgi:leucyl aminopeptidase
MKTKAFTSPSLAAVVADVLLVGVFEGENFDGAKGNSFAKSANLLTEGSLARKAEAVGFKGAVGETMEHFTDGKTAAKQILVFGMGARDKADLTVFRKAITAALRKARALKAKHVAFAAIDAAAIKSDAYGVGEALASYAAMIDYEMNHQKTEKGGYKGESHFAKLHLVVDAGSVKETARGLKDGFALAASVNLARDLANEPAGDCTPARMVKLAKKIAAESGGTIAVEIHDRKSLKKMGAGAFLAVAQGSDQPPYLIDMLYTPKSGTATAELTMVGKSVTFDSGGLDIKPADGMRDMKRDMSGGAATMAAIKAIAALGLNIKVRAVMAATENMTGGSAYKPGDVLKTMNGLTVEVDNTDAEGRLTLADAIEYAKRKGATRIIDLATLTGAVRMMVGDIACAAFGNNDEFTNLVVSSGDAQGERMLNVPMWKEYDASNNSDMADLKNSGGAPGSTTAAWFLRRFAGEDIPWVHLDIASVAFRTRELGPDPRGATGYGVRTLVEMARRLAK